MTTQENEYLKRVRIFIASPGDLKAERRLFSEALEYVNEIKAKSHGLLLEPVAWEDTLPGRGRPQETINQDLLGSDHVVFLLWKRWGTSTGNYSSGFEEEFELAISSDKEIWLYFRDVNDDMLADPGEQLRKVLDFRAKIESERKLLYSRYANEQEWRDIFIKHLCKWIEGTPIGVASTQNSSDTENRIQQLEEKLKKAEDVKTQAAITLALEATNHSNVGHVTKAQELFAQSLATQTTPLAIANYARLLFDIGAYDSARTKYSELVNLGQETNDQEAEAFGYMGMAWLQEHEGHRESAEKLYSQALEASRHAGSKRVEAECRSSLGYFYQTNGDIQKAMHHYDRAIRIFLSREDSRGAIGILMRLGLMFMTVGDLASAKRILDTSRQLCIDTQNTELLAEVFGNLGNLHLLQGSLIDAKRMFGKALKLHMSLGKASSVAMGFGSLAQVYVMTGHDRAAERLAQRALDIERRLGLDGESALEYLILAQVYMLRQQLAEAEDSCLRAYDLATKFDLVDKAAQASFNLGLIYGKMQQPDKSTQHLTRAATLFEESGDKQMHEATVKLLAARSTPDHSNGPTPNQAEAGP